MLAFFRNIGTYTYSFVYDSNGGQRTFRVTVVDQADVY